MISQLQSAVPGLLYVNGRFRAPADLQQLDLEDLQLPLSFYIRVDSSPFLERDFFAEPVLGLSLVHERGQYVFVYESGAQLAASAINAVPIAHSKLRKLFVRSPGTRLTHVSMLNANPGADQVRGRAVSAVRVDQLVPSFDEHGYVLRTATGYSRGRRDSGGEAHVRRYIGIESARVSDLARIIHE